MLYLQHLTQRNSRTSAWYERFKFFIILGHQEMYVSAICGKPLRNTVNVYVPISQTPIISINI